MNNSLRLGAGRVAILLALGASTAFAGDQPITVTGEAKCAACLMHKGDKCQTVIETTKNGKTIDYYVVGNDVSKGYQGDVCHSAQKVTATGTVKKEGKKRALTLMKIEPAK